MVTPEQDASWQDYLNHRRRGLSLVGSRDEINRMLLAVDAELRDLRAEVARLNRDLIGQESDAATRMMEFLRLFDEVETLRAALAASQTREATLRRASNSLAAWAYSIVNPGELPSSYHEVMALLAEPKGVSIGG